MITADDILAAHRRIRTRVRQTPYLRCAPLSDAAGAEVWVKSEHLQLTGSFKLRGAFNKLLTLSPSEREHGVVAASSGNHGAAVAYTCASLGVHARVFVPEGASAAKVERIREMGAEVVFFGTDGLDTEVEARRQAGEAGATYVSPYNDEAVVAGQGTLALEMTQQGPPLDRVYVAVGGGGLIAGMATWLKQAMPVTRIVGALPLNSPVMAESVKAGRILELESHSTLSDGTAGGIEAGSITFDMCRDLVDAWETVTEAEIGAAMRTWAASHDDMIEGAAAVALAAMLRAAPASPGARVGVVICGGNVARERWDRVLASRDPE